MLIDTSLTIAFKCPHVALSNFLIYRFLNYYIIKNIFLLAGVIIPELNYL